MNPFTSSLLHLSDGPPSAERLCIGTTLQQIAKHHEELALVQKYLFKGEVGSVLVFETDRQEMRDIALPTDSLVRGTSFLLKNEESIHAQ